MRTKAQDGTTTRAYTIQVMRLKSSDAALSSLTLSSGALSPTFSPDTTDYTVNVGSSVSEVTVTPVTRGPDATYTVNGILPTAGQTGVNIALNQTGSTTAIPVEVTAPDGTTTKIYTLNIARASDNSTYNSSVPSLPVSVADTSTNTTADLSGATFPSGITGVTLSVSPETATGAPTETTGGASDQTGSTVYHLAISQTGLNVIGSPFIYDIKLLDQNGTPITSFTGSVTVRVTVPAGIHGTPHIFRYEDSTGTFTDLGATMQGGYLVFTTTHFSYYVIAGTGDSVTLDTKSDQLPVGGSYQIGVKLTGTKAASVKVASTNNKVAAAERLKNGNVQVTAKGTGTAYIMIDVYDSKNHPLTHASVRVDVKTSNRSRGDSTRQIGVF